MRIMLDNFIGDLPARQLCRCDLDAAPKLEVSAVDLTFIPRQSSFWLRRIPRALTQNALDFLSHRVSNNPKDLMIHVQRVAVHYQSGTAESLYGAMLDLFIALDTKGYDLRKRLLAKCVHLFGKDQKQALLRGLESGLKSTDPVPFSVTSILKEPVSGSLLLVERQDTRVAVVNFDALDEARDLIDSGFMEEARQLLEELIVRQSEDEETNKELLDLYKYTKNKKAFFAIRERLQGKPLALADMWDEMADKFMSMEERVGNE